LEIYKKFKKEFLPENIKRVRQGKFLEGPERPMRILAKIKFKKYGKQEGGRLDDQIPRKKNLEIGRQEKKRTTKEEINGTQEKFPPAKKNQNINSGGEARH
jgi:hypothetical protein